MSKILAMVIGFLCFFPSISYGFEAELYQEALKLYRLRQPEAAADMLKSYASDLDRYAEDSYDLEEAAFAYVLATIALNKSGNNEAYYTWNKAQKLYEEVGITWEEEQRTLALRIQNLRSSLSGPTEFTLDTADQVLLDIEEVMRVSLFNEPDADLRQRNKRQTSRFRRQKEEKSNDAERPQFFARPRSNQKSNFDERRHVQEDDEELPRLGTRGLRYYKNDEQEQRQRYDGIQKNQEPIYKP